MRTHCSERHVHAYTQLMVYSNQTIKFECSEKGRKGYSKYMKLYNIESFRLKKTFQVIESKLWFYRGVSQPVLPSLFCCWVWKEVLVMETGHINPHFLPSEADCSVWKLLQLLALSWDLSASSRRHMGKAIYKQDQRANSHRRRSSQSYTCL